MSNVGRSWVGARSESEERWVDYVRLVSHDRDPNEL